MGSLSLFVACLPLTRLFRFVFAQKIAFKFNAKVVLRYQFLHMYAAHAIIFGRGTTFPSPVKKMLRKFAMLFDFLLVTRFFFKRLQKVVPSSRTRAAVKFRTKNNGVCTPEDEDFISRVVEIVAPQLA